MLFKTLDFSRHTSLKIGPCVNVKILTQPKDYAEEFVVGGGYNLLIGPNPPLLTILDKGKFGNITLIKGKLHVGGAVSAAKLYRFCKENNLGGLEFLGKLPGTVGGLVRMNAGLKEYDIASCLEGGYLLNGFVTKDELGLNYRKSTFNGPLFEAVFTPQGSFDHNKIPLFEKMRANQPKGLSAGSFFKNPKGDFAGRLIDAVGLKGKQKGGAFFSDIHANFLMSDGTATFEDVITLAQEAKKRVFEQFGIILENEVQIVEKEFSL